MTYEEKWRAAGMALGYPACCIDAFVERGQKILASGQPFPLDENQFQIALENTGFVPCPACAARVVAGTPLASLITNRADFLPPFPNR